MVVFFWVCVLIFPLLLTLCSNWAVVLGWRGHCLKLQKSVALWSIDFWCFQGEVWSLLFSSVLWSLPRKGSFPPIATCASTLPSPVTKTPTLLQLQSLLLPSVLELRSESQDPLVTCLATFSSCYLVLKSNQDQW